MVLRLSNVLIMKTILPHIFINPKITIIPYYQPLNKEIKVKTKNNKAIKKIRIKIKSYHVIFHTLLTKINYLCKLQLTNRK